MTSPRFSGALRLLPACAALACFAAPALAADYSPYPKAGVYDASDAQFERVLTVKANGKFVLEVQQKGQPGNLRSGVGEGQLADAPGGWNFSEGRCAMALKRAAGGMQMQVQGCSSAWGDVPFDAKYTFQGDAPAARPAPAAKAAPTLAPTPSATSATSAPNAASPTTPSPATAGNSASPTRKELRDQWQALQVDEIRGKSVQFWARPAADQGAAGGPLERYSQAAFVVDVTSDYSRLPAADLGKRPLQWVEIPLPATSAKEGFAWKSDCVFGKSDKVIVISTTQLAKSNALSAKRTSAWMLNDKLQAVEIKPASKAHCNATNFY